MFNFSGVLYRIWGGCGVILVLGVACILLNRPWARKVKIKDCKLGLIMIAAAIGLSLLYASRIVFPGVSSYTDEFIDSHRNSRVAPPLPVTNEYVFWNGEGKNNLLSGHFLKKEIFPDDFVSDRKYTIYFDEFTNVIVQVECIE